MKVAIILCPSMSILYPEVSPDLEEIRPKYSIANLHFIAAIIYLFVHLI